MTITVKGDREVAIKLDELGVRASLQLVKATSKLALKLQRRVMREKLTGQVLKVRTGTLRRSIDQVVVQNAGSVTGIVSTNVEYAAAHEYGLKKQLTVKEHLRTIKQAWGKSIAPKQIQVREHTRTANLPERSFVRSALQDMSPEIVAELQQAVAGELK